MLIKPKKYEEEDKEDSIEEKITKFQVLPGGKDPTHNWLRDLPEGQWFSCKVRGSRSFDLLEFCVIYHTTSGRGTYLGTRLSEISRKLVLNKEFSRDFELEELLEEGIDG